MPKTFAQYLDTTTLAPNAYDEEINARKHFELVLECLDDTTTEIRIALTERDVAKQELVVTKKLRTLACLTRSAARVFNDYKVDQFDIVEES